MGGAFFGQSLILISRNVVCFSHNSSATFPDPHTLKPEIILCTGVTLFTTRFFKKSKVKFYCTYVSSIFCHYILAIECYLRCNIYTNKYNCFQINSIGQYSVLHQVLENESTSLSG